MMRLAILATLLLWGISSSHGFVNPVRQPIRWQQQQEYLSQQKRMMSSKHSNNDDDDDSSAKPPVTRRQRIRRSLKKSLVSFALATSVWTTSRTAANAKFSYELRDQQTTSIRPGMSRTQAEQAKKGELDVDKVESRSVFTKPSAETVEKKTTPKKKKESSEFLYQDDEDNLLEEEDVIGSSVVGSQSDQMVAKRLKSQTTSQFASNSKGKSVGLTVKVAIVLFVPTFGAQIIREYVRRGREERYVQKGLEILEAQKKEYFNITETANDSDVADELKGLKKNATKTGDDDEDEDDDSEDDDESDEDDDEPERPSRRRRGGPPKGDGGGDDGGSSGGGGADSDPGYGKPSDEDLDKLNKMFGRS